MQDLTIRKYAEFFSKKTFSIILFNYFLSLYLIAIKFNHLAVFKHTLYAV